MKYLLDTNVCIAVLSGRNERLREAVQQQNPSDLSVCSVVKAELWYGAAKSGRPEATRREQDAWLDRLVSHPFDDAAADHYSHIRAELEKRGLPIGGNDLMIASIALSRGLILVTHNTAEFDRVPGLRIEDWSVNSA